MARVKAILVILVFVGALFVPTLSANFAVPDLPVCCGRSGARAVAPFVGRAERPRRGARQLVAQCPYSSTSKPAVLTHGSGIALPAGSISIDPLERGTAVARRAIICSPLHYFEQPEARPPSTAILDSTDPDPEKMRAAVFGLAIVAITHLAQTLRTNCASLEGP